MATKAYYPSIFETFGSYPRLRSQLVQAFKDALKESQSPGRHPLLSLDEKSLRKEGGGRSFETLQYRTRLTS